MSTSLLSHQLPLPETLNRQTPVLLCELAFYSRVSQTASGASLPPGSLTRSLHSLSTSLSLFLSLCLAFTSPHPVSPPLPPRQPLVLLLAIVISLSFPLPLQLHLPNSSFFHPRFNSHFSISFLSGSNNLIF